MAAVGNTPIDSISAQRIQEAARGRWASRLELSRLSGVNPRSGDFYVRALYKAGRLMRRQQPYIHPAVSQYVYEYRLKGT